MALSALMAGAAGAGGTARAQGWGPADDAPRVFVNGQPVGEAPPPPAAVDGVRVDITSDSPDVRLLQVEGERETVVCGPPCGVVVPRNAQYQLGGAGVVRSSKFTVPDNRADLHLYVDSGSNAKRVAGVVLGAAGYGLVLASDLFLTVEDNRMNQTVNRRARDVGLVLVGSGLVVGTVGLVLILTTRTRVATSSGVTFSYASPSRRRTAIRLTPAGLEF